MMAPVPNNGPNETLSDMNKLKSLVTVLALVTALPLMAQQKRLSPHETVSTVIDGCRVMVIYGRPYTKNPRTGQVRKIWGELVPYGKVWRTGADEATLLVTEKPLMFGDTTVPAGAYTLWTLPQEDGSAKLIINKKIGQWGEGEDVYQENQNVATVDMKKEALDTPVDQFTMAVAKGPQGGGTIALSWENAKFTAPFKVQK